MTTKATRARSTNGLAVTHTPRMVSLRKLLRQAAHALAGTMLGIVILEGTLRANPSLLLRGMALPSPADPRVQTLAYDVRASQADIFFWIPDLVRPIDAAADSIEAHVRFETDEFGFPNRAPLPALADAVVLGRSYSLGAQASEPWPARVAQRMGWQMVNLSQAASGIDLKTDYLIRFGLPRHPRWVIVEVLPTMDILDYQPPPPSLVSGLPFPLLQDLARAVVATRRPAQPSEYLYPLPVTLSGRRWMVTFFPFYLAGLTIETKTLEDSEQWEAFRLSLQRLIGEAERSGACVALLYAPTNAEIVFRAADNPEELTPALPQVVSWGADAVGHLRQDGSVQASVPFMREHAFAARDALAALAADLGVEWIDPSGAMLATYQRGENPFMMYDTHWSFVGHTIVADEAAARLTEASCP